MAYSETADNNMNALSCYHRIVFYFYLIELAIHVNKNPEQRLIIQRDSIPKTELEKPCCCFAVYQLATLKTNNSALQHQYLLQTLSFSKDRLNLLCPANRWLF